MPVPAQPKRDWSSVPIEAIIDREFGLSPELKSGASAYADMLGEWRQSGDDVQFLERLLDHAGACYRNSGQPQAHLYTFSDGAVNYLYDMVLDRVVLVWGVSRTVAPNSRDDAYHAGYPSAGKDTDKGHAWSHAQGGREGGPNYFRQARRLNQGRSVNGKLWRAIESYLAANAGLSAFIRLIYATQNQGDRPDEVEYGIVSSTGQFRAVIFPNS
ncbi:hypothetical protein GON01_02485 [Sphingomonas sp. MAH-20]|uniref:Uncharacterized protein n=1 Tax=Sphingomonas horti TaxID=2682842 RepID=A0A6I4IXE7_9SPHN|nr:MULTISPECIES: hypothetical protein [Sphingomonas]MBA2920557.1 hypothetical protein [Sphingomonas sp. CGMCC 1.13658]MVO76809.1 hypothetical protein [Sphingomonas horti]